MSVNNIFAGYRRASFAGVNFYVSHTQDAFGRRGAHHEFPFKDKGLWDDLGAKDARRQIEAYTTNTLLGGFAAARDRLIAALQKGPGELVHPWLGRHQVVCQDFTVGHDDKELGLARISITFIEADFSASAPADNWTAQLLSGVEDGLTALSDLFAGNFSIEACAAFVVNLAGSSLGGALGNLGKYFAAASDFFAPFTPLLSAALRFYGILTQKKPSAPEIFNFKKDFIMSNLPDFLNAPGPLGREIINLHRFFIPAQPEPKIAWRNLGDLWAGVPEVKINSNSQGYTAPSQERINLNNEALSTLFKGAATLEAARLIPFMPINNQSEAAAVKETLIFHFDHLLERADAVLYQAASRTQALALQIISAAAPDSSRVGQLTLSADRPALALVYDLYGAIDLEGDFVSRNNIAHPGFVPGGRALEYLHV